MRKHFAIIALLLSAGMAQASPVTVEKATALAAKMFNGMAATKAGGAPVLVWTGETATKGPWLPAYYVFNNPGGGFVIISGEDAARPILAWADEGEFSPDGMPENLSDWFWQYDEQIALLRMNNAVQDAATAQMWDQIRAGRYPKAASRRLTTPIWSQRAPFYNYCPKIGEQRTLTGCTATAACEVMYYHRYPTRGYGTLPDYTYTKNGVSYSQPGHELTATYEYGKMLTSYKSGYTAEQGDAVARLMFDVGVMSQATYGTSATGASLITAGAGLIKYMGYDSSMVYRLRDGYTETQWVTFIKDDINAGLPVLYSGFNPGGGAGHAFVLEGYDDNENIYVNWGWGGTSNGYYAISAFVMGNSDYRSNQSAIFGIKPGAGGSANQGSLAHSYSSSYNCWMSLAENIGVPKKDDYVKVNFTASNKGYYQQEFNMMLAVVDYRGKFLYGRRYNKTISPNYSVIYQGSDLLIQREPRLGHRIMLMYRPYGVAYDSPAEYLPVYQKTSTNPNRYNNYIPLYDKSFIKVSPDGYSDGDWFDFEIDNTRIVPEDLSVEWFLDGVQMASNRVRLNYGSHTVKARITMPSGAVRTLVAKIDVN